MSQQQKVQQEVVKRSSHINTCQQENKKSQQGWPKKPQSLQAWSSILCVSSVGPYTCNTPSAHALHQVSDGLLWKPIPFLLQCLDQHLSGRWLPPPCRNTSAKLIPQLLNGVEVRGVGHPLHHLNALCLEEVGGQPCYMGPGNILLEDVNFWMGLHKRYQVGFQDLIDIPLCI